MKEPLDYHQIERVKSLPLFVLIILFALEANWILCSINMWLGEYFILLYLYVIIINFIGGWVYFSNLTILKYIHSIITMINIIYWSYIIFT